MRPLIESLLRIQTLRRQHTNAFMAQDGQAGDRINKKILSAWDDYRTREELVFEAGACYSCGKPAVPKFKVERPNHTGPQLFCSAECSKRFGIMLGNT